MPSFLQILLPCFLKKSSHTNQGILVSDLKGTLHCNILLGRAYCFKGSPPPNCDKEGFETPEKLGVGVV